jgi:hypothetical protein
MKWEYLTISIEAKGIWNKKFNEKASVEKLNELGAEGWELVSVTPIERTGTWSHQVATYAFAFIFKRPQQ